ncbi:MAG TPA: MarR family transcriptional regulator [Dehalococcoidia bacterium]|nr:MarR family transcriptional regulator [Dehalococcoidia bacterium]
MISDELIHRATQLYGRAASLVDPQRIGVWEELGLTIPQLRVLFFLQREPNAPAGAIAQHLGVTPSTVTGLVDRLVRTRLVRRVEDPADRRMVRNTLTDRGREVVSELEQSGRAYMADIFRSMTPEQLENLVRALDDLVEAAARTQAEAVSSGA